MSSPWSVSPSEPLEVCPAQYATRSPPVTSIACENPYWSCPLQGLTLRCSMSPPSLEGPVAREPTLVARRSGLLVRPAQDQGLEKLRDGGRGPRGAVALDLPVVRRPA